MLHRYLSQANRAAVLAAFALSAIYCAHTLAQAPAPKADVIVLSNGDRLTGQVVSEAGGTVTFKSDLGGTINVPWSSIKELHTTQQFAVIPKDQPVKVGKAAPEAAVGTVSFANDQVSVAGAGGATRILASKDTAYLVNAAEYDKITHHESSWRQGWLGSATAGASLVQATQTSRTFTGSIGLVRNVPGVDWIAPRYKTIFDSTAAYGSVHQPAVGTTPESSATTRIFHADIEQDWYLSSRLYALADAGWDHNLGAGLKLQQSYGGGVGYSVIRKPVETLDIKGDIHYEHQEFYPPGASLSVVGINLGETYMRKLQHGLTFNESALVQPAFNHPSAFTAQFNAGLIFPVYKNFGFSLGTQDNYLNNPPTGYKNNTFIFTAGLNYTFK